MAVDVDLQDLQKLPCLVSLDLTEVVLADEMLTKVGEMTRHTDLRLHRRKDQCISFPAIRITDLGLAALGTLTLLKHLRLAQCGLDDLLRHFRKMKVLEYLDLGQMPWN